MTNKEQFLKDISTSLLARMILAVKPKCEPCSKGNLDCKHGIEKWLLRKVKE